MTTRMDFLKESIQSLRDQNLFTELPVLSTEQRNRVVMNGKEVIMMCSNNYLGFANHPGLRAAAREAIDCWGFGAGAVRQIAGTMEIHIQLENMLAEYKHTEASLVFVAGIAANRGTIQSLMGEEDAIISDELNHGSIIDGVRLTRSRRMVYPHLDMDGLKKALQETKDARRRLIITDGVFSMDGDIAPLDQIVELAEEHDAMIMVDDAHGDGVLGKDGRGIIDHFGLDGRVDIDMGTMSKAFGSLGGYIAGRRELREYLINSARSFIFTTAHPPCVAAATMEALRMVQDEPEHLKKLWDNTRYFKKAMSDLGFDIGHSQTPITPVMAGESRTAVELSGQLFKEGLFAKPIVFPLVAKDKARVRIIVTAQHTDEDLDEAIAIFERVGKRMRLI
ncbi:putative 8-amino-7-oxononanoate synthase [Candidatus Methanoperedens nitroreducens]|uniref:8-amino-7-ketopelargonate synthase n=1 Tax=Candidatus Methanoperedens nitratireducens TaxID=1392998 RepID=A0A062V921_9EURY|nr:glycine C-acetyltransferase [Candidatus Methanoperedens nitroreducens]KCZ72259.1 putative 8-amino-7-oxononanoate synthase [Candidatus Methanoperedens nitroreducens]MDJ1421764.1 glycine C-acetyltransferase [Candidatus Methanoperedens sp.]